jgi:hypothetical protein
VSFDWFRWWMLPVAIVTVRLLWGIALGIRELHRRSSADFLDAVVLSGSPKTLEQARGLAKSVGWESSRFIDEQNLMIWSPKTYEPSSFGKLIEAFEKLEDREFGLRLMNGKRKFVGPDGQELES